MSLTGRMKLGFGALIAVMGIMIALNGSEVTWIKYWQGHTTGTLEEAGAANRLTASISSMRADVGALSEADARGGDLTQAGESFATDSAAATAALESLVASGGSRSEDAPALANLAGLLDQYRQAGDDLFTRAASDATGVAAGVAAIADLGTQLAEAASSYQESRLTVGMAKLDRLNLMATTCLALAVVLGSLAFFGGIVFAVRLTRKITGKLKEAVLGISGSASELLAVASQVAASSTETAASTNETTATVEEVKQTAVLAQRKAAQVAGSAESVAGLSQSGRSLVEGTVAGIEHMQSEMDVVSSAISRLSEQAQAVNDVMAVVNDLAEQTNLLSVNASIEAAKAGEQGKGFTVVAQEVKSLAEQSKQAVAQVRTILDEIRRASDMAVDAARRGRGAVDAGKEQSQESGRVIEELAAGAGQVAEAAAQISASSQQQLAGMEQIAQAIESINQASGQSVAGTRQVEQEVKNLQELALGLKRLVEAEAAA
jgi:methyl-accepting chemotaxis protein